MPASAPISGVRDRLSTSVKLGILGQGFQRKTHDVQNERKSTIADTSASKVLKFDIFAPVQDVDDLALNWASWLSAGFTA